MAPPAPGRFTTSTRCPSSLAVPSASSRAVTSAELPAGKSTVISIGPRCGYRGSCAHAVSATSAKIKGVSTTFLHNAINLACAPEMLIRPHYFGDFDAPAFARRFDAGEDHRERRRAFLAIHLRLGLAAHRARELLELFDDGVV